MMSLPVLSWTAPPNPVDSTSLPLDSTSLPLDNISLLLESTSSLTVPSPPPAGGTHPTGMHSYFDFATKFPPLTYNSVSYTH